MSVALAATLHDPRGDLTPFAAQALPDLVRLYQGLVIVATEETEPALLEGLARAGAIVEISPGAYEQVGGKRLDAVLRAATIAPAVHLCDFDRMLHWWHVARAELIEVLGRISRVDLLLLGRTARAWSTHPACQLETEQAANRAVSILYGRPADVCSGSRGLSRRAVAYLETHSRVRTVGSDAEWPLLLRNADGFSRAELETEGLEFETGDRFPDEIRRAGSHAAWLAELDRDATRWIERTRIASVIVETALETARRIAGDTIEIGTVNNDR